MAMINNRLVEVDAAMARLRKTILHECDLFNIYLPRFCYHDELSIAGNCRMCLVETNTSAKPVISCATVFSIKLEIFTDSALVKIARENVLELLLINHPLDCPICDQGGECDLQDQTMVFGSDRGRFSEDKRSVEDKEFSPLIKGIMTRCIHCTRCIRYADEVMGLPLIGTLGRGMLTEIGMFVSDVLNSKIVGNIADVCPVGALTFGSSAYTSRAWELIGIDTIDALDGMCSNIRMDVRGNVIIRILPRVNPLVNGEWITDEIRTSFNLILKDRLCFPMYRETLRSPFARCSWQRAFNVLCSHVGLELRSDSRFAYFVGPGADVYSTAILKYLACASAVDNVSPNLSVAIDERAEFILDISYAEENTVHLFFMIGVDPRTESPILHLKLTRVFGTERAIQVREQGGVLFTGTGVVLNYKLQQYNFGSLLLEYLSYGSRFYCTQVKFTEDCYYLKGESLSFFSATVNRATYCAYKILEKKGIRINLLAKNSTTIGVFEDAHGALNRSKTLFWTGEHEQPELLYFSKKRHPSSIHEGCVVVLSAQYFKSRKSLTRRHTAYVADNNETSLPYAYVGTSGVTRFCVYIGPYSYIAEACGANLVLPSNSFVEKTGSFINITGILQSTTKVVRLPVSLWSDEWIVLALSLFFAKYHPNVFCSATINRIFNRLKQKHLRYRKLPEQMPLHLLKKYYTIRRSFGLPERHNYSAEYQGDPFWPRKLDMEILQKKFFDSSCGLDTSSWLMAYVKYQRKVFRIYMAWKNPEYKFPAPMTYTERQDWLAKWKGMTLEQRGWYGLVRSFSFDGDSVTLDDVINNIR